MPEGYYSQETKNWPAILFLHGDGERGDGLDELAYTRIHGPLFEAWVMKKKLPFVLIVPQLPMFGRDTSITYFQNRSLSRVPIRLDDGVPKRDPYFDGLQFKVHPWWRYFQINYPYLTMGGIVLKKIY